MRKARKNLSLHGNVPNSSTWALVVVDMFNAFDFPGGSRLEKLAYRAALRIKALREKLRLRKIPTIFVNDNHGKLQSDQRSIVDRCLEPRCRGRRIAELLRPDRNDYFLLKTKASGFYQTQLELVLNYLGAENIIVSGISADHCLFFTAADAAMRDFEITVPLDTTAALTPAKKRAALNKLRELFQVKLPQSKNIQARK